ncbi:unnamed protein product [Peronospora destructor]|uniref:RING-type E3 ubiquitin transferase n=1 Tax=Peronospora destructor TaxID=86335 RepID=A0AAV0TU69_9STRA|nr:unnamed protein product [Peronospora destructor]
MGHTASVNRQRSSNAGAAAVSRGGCTPAQMQALYLSGGRPDMAFISNQVGNMPVGLPELQQTCTVKNHVNLKKASLKLHRPIKPQHYALEFQFDALKPCRISVYLVAAEAIDADTGGSSFALVHADKKPVLTQHYPLGMRQAFALTGGVTEEGTVTEEGEEKREHMLPLLDFSVYDPAELVYKDDTAQFPLIVVLEVVSDKIRPQSQSTFCTFFRNDEDCWDIKMLKQKILVDGLTYELQEIYGIDGSVTAAPDAEQNNATGQDQADATQTAKDENEIHEKAECIICLCESRNTTILPCRHMCLCSECAEAMRKSSSTCPICRTRIEALLHIRAKAKETTTTEE